MRYLTVYRMGYRMKIVHVLQRDTKLMILRLKAGRHFFPLYTNQRSPASWPLDTPGLLQLFLLLPGFLAAVAPQTLR